MHLVARHECRLKDHLIFCNSFQMEGFWVVFCWGTSFFAYYKDQTNNYGQRFFHQLLTGSCIVMVVGWMEMMVSTAKYEMVIRAHYNLSKPNQVWWFQQIHVGVSLTLPYMIMAREILQARTTKAPDLFPSMTSGTSSKKTCLILTTQARGKI